MVPLSHAGYSGHASQTLYRCAHLVYCNLVSNTAENHLLFFQQIMSLGHFDYVTWLLFGVIKYRYIFFTSWAQNKFNKSLRSMFPRPPNHQCYFCLKRHGWCSLRHLLEKRARDFQLHLKPRSKIPGVCVAQHCFTRMFTGASTNCSTMFSYFPIFFFLRCRDPLSFGAWIFH